MATGIALTAFGTLSVVGGAITMGVGMTTDECKWHDSIDCNSTNDFRLMLIGLGILAGGGGLGLGLGIPLWRRGARGGPDPDDAEDEEGEEDAMSSPDLLAGPGSAAVRWRF